MIVFTRQYMMAIASAAVLALGLYGCGGGGGGPVADGDGMTTPVAVDLSSVTAGFMAGAGTVQVAAGQSMVHGDVEFSCAADGADCEITVAVDANRAITATSTGGTVTAMNSADYQNAVTPMSVNLASVTAGFTAVAGTVTIAAGQSADHGDVSFACAAGGRDCTVTVTVDANGDITATSTGGTVTAMNSADYQNAVTPMSVYLAGVTAGFMADAGTVTVVAGQSADHGDISFSCAAGGRDCEITVAVDANGDITATSTGGSVTAMNSDDYDRRLQVIPEQRDKEQAIHRELSRLIVLSSGVISDFPGITHSTSRSPDSGSSHLQLLKSYRELYTLAVPWRDSNDALNFTVSLGGDELPPDATIDYHGRSISGSPDDLLSSHELGTDSQIDWQVFSTTKRYSDRTLEVQFVTDVEASESPGQTWVGYGEGAAGHTILPDGIPQPARRSRLQGVSIDAGVTLSGTLMEYPENSRAIRGKPAVWKSNGGSAGPNTIFPLEP